MKRLINNRVIILLCLFLSVCSNKIKDDFDTLYWPDIKDANIEGMNVQLEIDRYFEKSILSRILEYFGMKPKLYYNLSFLYDLFNLDKEFFYDIKISYTYADSEKNDLKKFKYQCGSKKSYTLSLSDIGIDFDEKRLQWWITKRSPKKFAQHFVLRKCIENGLKCHISDYFCIIQNLAKYSGSEVIIFEPKDHGLTKENLVKNKIENLNAFSNEAIIPKETVNFAILYSEYTYTFKTQSMEFDFNEAFSNTEYPPYLIIYKYPNLVKFKNPKDERIIKNFKENIMQVNDKNDPINIFFTEYKEFTEKNPDQLFAINEKYVIKKFNEKSIRNDKDKKSMIAKWLMNLLKLFYLEFEKISKTIKSFP